MLQWEEQKKVEKKVFDVYGWKKIRREVIFEEENFCIFVKREKQLQWEENCWGKVGKEKCNILKQKAVKMNKRVH